MTKFRFRVDSRIATLLSQEYSSTERALKELIDNAWDADAEQVRIDLPRPMTDDPIVIHDNGNGMTEEELRRHYLSIATDRRSMRGSRTSGKQRQIKGRKGIGKFAGLMAAEVMMLETKANGWKSNLRFDLKDLADAQNIEQLPISHESRRCSEDLHGTSITLTALHQGLAYPDPTKLKRILLQDYGRHDDFEIIIDGKRLGIDDVSGAYTQQNATLPNAGPIDLRFAISDDRSGLRQPGITIRVDGKAIGKPTFFGLEKCESFPQKLLNKLYGEIDADGLQPHVTAGWDSLVENSELLQELESYVLPVLNSAFQQQYGKEMQLAQARLQRSVQDRLAKLPEHKREFAEKAIRKVLDRYYGEPEAKIEPMVYVLLEALERSDYRILLEHVASSKKSDIASVAESLESFGLADMAHLVEQASARLVFLDHLEALSLNASTAEKPMHQAIASNMWVFGSSYSAFTSNRTLKRLVEDYLDKEYSGSLPAERPDLILHEDLNGVYLLIEFKEPGHPLNLSDYQQATRYRHDFGRNTGKQIQVVLIGGKLSHSFPNRNLEPDVAVSLYSDVISSARRQIEWLLRDGG